MTHPRLQEDRLDERDTIIDDWHQGRHDCPVGPLLRLDTILNAVIEGNAISMNLSGLMRRHTLATQSNRSLWKTLPDQWTAEQVGLQVCNIVLAEASMARVCGDNVLDVELRQWHAHLMDSQAWKMLGENWEGREGNSSPSPPSKV